MKNYIREQRELKGLSQTALADLANTTHQQIHFLETGKRKLTWEWIKRLSVALDVPALFLVGVNEEQDAGSDHERELVALIRTLTPKEQRFLYNVASSLGKDDDEDQTGPLKNPAPPHAPKPIALPKKKPKAEKV